MANVAAKAHETPGTAHRHQHEHPYGLPATGEAHVKRGTPWTAGQIGCEHCLQSKTTVANVPRESMAATRALNNKRPTNSAGLSLR